jgi:CRP-like cAMP-binding protein
MQPTVLLELHLELLKSCGWLQETSFACCCDFLLALRPEVLLQGDTLLKAGIVSRSVYILVDGELRLTFPPEGAQLTKLALILGDNAAQIKQSNAGQRSSQRIPQGRVERIGSLVGWGAPHGQARPLAYTAVASRDTSLLSISRDQLAAVLSKYPQEAVIFKRASDHAARLINPVKRSSTVAKSDRASKRSAEDAIEGNFANRASRTDEMMKSASSDCGPSARRCNRMSARDPAENEEDETAEAMTASGWLMGGGGGGHGATVTAGSDEGSCKDGQAANASMRMDGLSMDEKLGMLLGEILEMKQSMAAQATETAELRKALASRGLSA